MKKLPYISIFSSLAVICFVGCNQFLEAVPDRKMAIPSTLDDLDLMLANFNIMNGNLPYSSETMCDDYYLTTTTFNSIADIHIRNQYCWQKDESANWDKLYSPVLIANAILDQLHSASFDAVASSATAERIQGSALFFKGFYYYFTAQLYAPPYNAQTAAADPGIVLRENSDFNVRSTRASNEETYAEIVRCLKTAAALLPAKPTPLKSAPSKPAAYGALARTYLAMQQYEQAGLYADSCIQLYGADSLLNLNNSADVNLTANLPFKRFNKEVIFHCTGASTSMINQTNAKADSVLYLSFLVNDLRKIAYFKANTGANTGTYAFKGRYDATNNTIFGGIALNEMYLIRAECAARAGHLEAAMQDLNKLLETRFVTGSLVPYSITGQTDGIQVILAERRKELLFRGLRWTDLRRLQHESDYAVTPKRVLDGQAYQLLPGSPRYTVLIPQEVIELSGISQNP